MKSFIVLVAMLVSSLSFAAYVDYGPGSYTKKVYVCYKSGNRQCQWNNCRFYAPRNERVEITNGHSNVIGSYIRRTTGNWGTVRFKNKADERRYAECERRAERGYIDSNNPSCL